MRFKKFKSEQRKLENPNNIDPLNAKFKQVDIVLEKSAMPIYASDKTFQPAEIF